MQRLSVVVALALTLTSPHALAGDAARIDAQPKKDAAPAAPAPAKAPSTTAEIGAPAPDFTLVDEMGKKHTLSSYKGKTVVLEWTNPECPYVKRHVGKGTMQGLASKWAKKDVVWLAVNSTHSATAEKTRAWRAEKGLPYATLHDPDGVVGKRYAAKTTPHMFIVDKDGVLRYAGAIDDDPHGDAASPSSYIDAALTALTSGGRPTNPSTKPYGCSVKYKS